MSTDYLGGSKPIHFGALRDPQETSAKIGGLSFTEALDAALDALEEKRRCRSIDYFLAHSARRGCHAYGSVAPAQVMWLSMRETIASHSMKKDAPLLSGLELNHRPYPMVPATLAPNGVLERAGKPERSISGLWPATISATSRPAPQDMVHPR